MVSQCESDDSAFGDRTVGQLKSELQRLKKQESDLLEMFPEFDEYRSQEPASPEEEVLARLEERINAIKLELVKRGEDPQEIETILRKSQPEVVKRLAVILQNPQLSAENLCKSFDFAHVLLLEVWPEDFGVSTWVQAYKQKRLRGRIQTIISKGRRKAK